MESATNLTPTSTGLSSIQVENLLFQDDNLEIELRTCKNETDGPICLPYIPACSLCLCIVIDEVT